MRKDRSIRNLICEIARNVWTRRLSDCSGGNISARKGDLVYMSPRYSGSRLRWRLSPRDIVVIDIQTGHFFSSFHKPSREAQMHLAIYRAFPNVGGIVHAHPYHAMAFACLERPIPAAAEYTIKLGTIPLTRRAAAHSPELAEAVVEAMKGGQGGKPRHLAVLIPKHGIVCVGEDVAEAYDVLERVEASARIALFSKLLLLKHCDS